jgi:hypothetical protein
MDIGAGEWPERILVADGMRFEFRVVDCDSWADFEALMES